MFDRYKKICELIMRKILLLFIVIMIENNCFSQDKYNIIGQVEADSLFVKYISVKLFADTILLQATITDENGMFAFNKIEKGDYRINIVSLFYEGKDINVSLKENTSLGIIKLKEAPMMLDEVNIETNVNPIEFTTNGVILNISNTNLIKYRNASELIGFAPVTFINSEIGQFENAGLEIMINGKPVNIPVEQQENFLSSISSENIVKIEIVDKPDASVPGNKYGCVNIILKQNKGISGVVEAKLMYHKTFFQTYNASLFCNTENARLYTLINADIRKLEYVNSNIEYRNGTRVESSSTKLSDIITPSIIIGLDYSMKHKSEIGFLFSYLHENNKQIKQKGRFCFVDCNDSTIVVDSDDMSKYHSIDFTVNYALNVDTIGSNFSSYISFSSPFSRSNSINNFLFFNSSQTSSPEILNYNYITNSSNYILGHESKYIQMFRNKSQLNFGYKFTFTDYNYGWISDNIQNSILLSNDNYSYHLDMKECIAALYGAYVVPLKKSTVSISIRGEYNQNNYINGENISSVTSSIILLPRFIHNIRIDSKNVLYYYLSRNVYRPNFYNYIEASTYNPISQRIGDSKLDPQNQWIAAVGYIYKGEYSLKIFGARSPNLSLSVPKINNGVLVYNTINKAGILNRIGMDVDLPIDFFDWWETNTNISVQYVNMKYKPMDYVSSGFHWNFFHSSDFSITKNLWVSVDYSYTSKNKTFFMETKGYHSVGLWLGYMLKHLNISFAVLDIFNSEVTRTKYDYRGIIYGECEYKQLYSRTFRIGLSYDFSLGNGKSFDQKESGIENQKGRIK